jgi:hypothetical protein
MSGVGASKPWGYRPEAAIEHGGQLTYQAFLSNQEQCLNAATAR